MNTFPPAVPRFDREYREWLKKNEISFRQEQKEKEYHFPAFVVGICLLLAATILIASCDEAKAYTDDEIVSAIYKAEGGQKASKPYGIMLPKCNWSNVAYCKKACYQTVANNRKRFAEWGYKTHPTYLSFLASRYAPTEGATNDPLGLNRNWLRNVEAILARRAK